MTKKEKIWMFVLICLLVFDVIMHFAACETPFSYHLNYIASVLLSLTIGLFAADTPKFKNM